MELVPILKNSNIKILSIFGLSKNCGKTTTLIKIIDEAKIKNLKILITSIGLDGERFDSLYYFEKPLIKGYKGNLIVTSKNSIDKLGIKYEILKKFDIYTPLGELFLIKLIEDGEVEVSGPIILKDLKTILDESKKYDLDLILIDGAIDRKIGTIFSEGVILQTGLNIGEKAENVIDETLYYKEIFSIESLDEKLKEKILKNYPTKKYLYIKGEIFNEKDEIDEEDFDFLFIKGAVTNEVYEKLKDKKDKKIVVEHSTKILINREIYKKLQSLKFKFLTINPVKIVGVSFSTFNQNGYFDREEGEEVFNNLKDLLKPLIVFDVLEKS